MNVKRWLSIFISLVMLISLFPISALAEGSPEYAFIPNSGEASVSKVDLTGMTEVARYYTAPRVSATADRAWRTSRIVQDAKGNAFVLNTGADGTNLQGSAARIQADTSGLTSTHAYPADVLPFGTDQAVQVMNVGLPGEIPRAIEIEEKDGKVYLWIGFYSGGYLQKYEYNPAGPSLDPVAGANYRYTTDIKYYDMKFAPDGKLWISSRDSTPTVDGTPGIFSFDPSTGVFVREQTFVPYSLLIADDGTVYATSYNNQLHIRSTAGVWTTKTLTGSPEDRGMAFDNLGNIWIASTTGTSGGTTVKSYNIASGSQGATYTLTSGTTPVGLGMDTNGTMWVVCRSDAMAEGWLEGFKPDTLAKVGAIEVGFRPYAYGGFVIPEPELYNLCGYKLDADTGKGLAGWTINLKDSSGAVIDSTVTGPDGKYCFTGLTAGTYTVEEVPQDNWEQVYPAGGSHTVTLPEEPMIFGIERTGLRPVLRINPITGACSSLFNTNTLSKNIIQIRLIRIETRLVPAPVARRSLASRHAVRHGVFINGCAVDAGGGRRFACESLTSCSGGGIPSPPPVGLLPPLLKGGGPPQRWGILLSALQRWWDSSFRLAAVEGFFLRWGESLRHANKFACHLPLTREARKVRPYPFKKYHPNPSDPNRNPSCPSPRRTSISCLPPCRSAWC